MEELAASMVGERRRMGRKVGSLAGAEGAEPGPVGQEGLARAWER